MKDQFACSLYVVSLQHLTTELDQGEFLTIAMVKKSCRYSHSCAFMFSILRHPREACYNLVPRPRTWLIFLSETQFTHTARLPRKVREITPFLGICSAIVGRHGLNRDAWPSRHSYSQRRLHRLIVLRELCRLLVYAQASTSEDFPTWRVQLVSQHVHRSGKVDE